MSNGIMKRAACYYCRWPARGQTFDAKEFTTMDPELKQRAMRSWLADLCAEHEVAWTAALLKADAS